MKYKRLLQQDGVYANFNEVESAGNGMVMAECDDDNDGKRQTAR